MVEVTVGGVVIALVNAIKELKNKNWEPLLWVVVSGVVGGLAAQYGLGDASHVGWLAGAFMGVAASGAYALGTQVADRINK